jgi:RNA polymerase sigma-70 factor (ECF subfamily)
MDDTAGVPGDTELVIAALKDKEVFGLLIQRYEDRLRRYVRRLGVWLPDEQDDLLQDIFVKIYRNLHAFDQTLSFSSWVYRIAHNETVSSFRRRSSRGEGMGTLDADEVLERLPDVTSLSDELSAQYDGTLVKSAVEKLDDKYRDIILLRYFEGMEYEEISDILEIPLGSVSTRIHRAKERLRAHLEHMVV